MKLQFVVTVAFHQTEMPVVARQLGYKHIFCLNVVSTKKLLLLIIIIIGIQPVGRSGQRPELSQATGMALVRCNLGKFLGVACHCFPPLFRLFPLFTTRCLHVRHDVRDPSGGSGNCGREC